MAAPIARVQTATSEVRVELRTDLPLGEPMRVRVVVVLRSDSEQHDAHILLGGFGQARGPSIALVRDRAPAKLEAASAAVVGVVLRWAPLMTTAARSVAQGIESLQLGAAALRDELACVVTGLSVDATR